MYWQAYFVKGKVFPIHAMKANEGVDV